MAAALIAGLANELTQAADIHVVDPNAEALARLRTQYGVTTAGAIDALVSGAEVIVLAVKPQSMHEVTAQLLPFVNKLKQPLVVSIAAGIRSADLSRWLGGYGALVRCMPNTPALVQQGITGMVAMQGVTQAQKDYFQAEANRIQADADLAFSRISLRVSAGKPPKLGQQSGSSLPIEKQPEAPPTTQPVDTNPNNTAPAKPVTPAR